MRKDRWFRPEIKPAVLIIQFCLVTAGVFAQRVPQQYLSPSIVENFIANKNDMSSAFDALENHQDPKVQRQYAEYKKQVNLFGERLSSFMYLIYGMEDDYDMGENYDIPKAYRKVLQIYVPPAAKAIYLEIGFGEQGHQAYMCLFLGIMLTVAKQSTADIEPDSDPIPNKTRKLLAVIESLIHSQDLALIEEYFEKLLEAVYE